MTQEELKTIIHYDPETGILIRLNGKKCGFINYSRKGIPRLCISLKGKEYKAHRIIFLYMTGEIPKYVDHIDGNGLNNKWNNLRPATLSENNRNSKLRKDNTSGYKGVSFYRNKWKCSIKVNNKQLTIGIFSTKEEAHQAYCEAAIKYFGEFAKFK